MLVDQACLPRALPLFAAATMPGYSVPYVHSGDPGYAPPVLRAPSPTDSIGTDYGPDETSAEDVLCAEDDFAARVEEALGLRRSTHTWADAGPPKPVLLPKTKDPKEEQRESFRRRLWLGW